MILFGTPQLTQPAAGIQRAWLVNFPSITPTSGLESGLPSADVIFGEFPSGSGIKVNLVGSSNVCQWFSTERSPAKAKSLENLPPSNSNRSSSSSRLCVYLVLVSSLHLSLSTKPKSKLNQLNTDWVCGCSGSSSSSSSSRVVLQLTALAEAFLFGGHAGCNPSQRALH